MLLSPKLPFLSVFLFQIKSRTCYSSEDSVCITAFAVYKNHTISAKRKTGIASSNPFRGLYVCAYFLFRCPVYVNSLSISRFRIWGVLKKDIAMFSSKFWIQICQQTCLKRGRKLTRVPTVFHFQTQAMSVTRLTDHTGFTTSRVQPVSVALSPGDKTDRAWRQVPSFRDFSTTFHAGEFRNHYLKQAQIYSFHFVHSSTRYLFVSLNTFLYVYQPVHS